MYFSRVSLQLQLLACPSKVRIGCGLVVEKVTMHTPSQQVESGKVPSRCSFTYSLMVRLYVAKGHAIAPSQYCAPGEAT